MLLFYTPGKHQKTFRFSDVFKWYGKATPGCNGLIKYNSMYYIFELGVSTLARAYRKTAQNI